MALLATVIIGIVAHSALPSMELTTRVALDRFGLLLGLIIVALLVALPFLILTREFLFLLLYFQFKFWGYLF